MSNIAKLNMNIGKIHTQFIMDSNEVLATKFSVFKSDLKNTEYLEEIIKICSDEYIQELNYNLPNGENWKDLLNDTIKIVQSETNIQKYIKRTFINFDFNTIPDDMLNFCLTMLNKEETIINLTITDKNYQVESNIIGLCDQTITDKDLIESVNNGTFKIKDKYYVYFKDNKLGKPFNVTIVNKFCNNCNYSRCPKAILGYLKYLKDNNLLEEKLQNRPTERVEFFNFKWNIDNGLKEVPEHLYELANELVNRGYVNVKRFLTDEDYVSIQTRYPCTKMRELTSIDLIKEEDLNPNEEYKGLLRLPSQKNIINTCTNANCRKEACVKNIAGYIYYLKMSGQKKQIEEDRQYYKEHEEEILKKVKELHKEKLENLNSTAQKSKQIISDSFDKFKNNTENLDVLIDKLSNTSEKNLYCVIEGEEGLDQDKLIDTIIEHIKNEITYEKKIKKEDGTETVSKYKNIQKLTLQQLAATLVVPFTNKDEHKYSKASYKNINKNTLYIINGIEEFIKDYNSYIKSNAVGEYMDFRKKQFLYVIDILSTISENTYITILGKEKEIEDFFEINSKLKYVYNQLKISIKNLTTNTLFEEYKKGLKPNVFDKLAANEQETKEKFKNYINLNRNLIPFKNYELSNYLSIYSNSNNDIVFPPDIYKKETLEEALKSIIGLEGVKEKVKELENFSFFHNKAISSGIDLPTQNLHMIFTGNPGTGKTTIARIMAKMLYDIGMLKENKLIEVERKDLIGQYTGQTAPKTMEVINKAMGGVLFIDEAYSLVMNENDTYGLECVATLIKAMEDKKGQFVVIFAGYKEEMRQFMDSNSGIASRIGYTFDFTDYTEEELVEIFKIKIKKSGMQYNEEILPKIKEICKIFKKRKNFGNGRFIDKLIQETLINHAKNYNENNLEIITAEDLPKIEELINSNQYEKGSTAQTFSNIIGLDLLKEKILEFENYVLFTKNANESGLNIPTQNLHMLFTGNPGTGKTTIARIIAKMLFDIGALHENKLVEVERKDLIGQYAGETPKKTAEVIEKAMGGVLFIDEAYSLVSGPHDAVGRIAVATLIKAMEDHKGEFVVIFAGYKDEMKQFMDSNSGIASRIGYTFDFPDYSTEELIQIFELKMSKNGFNLPKEANFELENICSYFRKRKNFGNGRFIDKLIQETLMNHAKNYNKNNFKMNEISIDELPTIENLTNTGYQKGNAKASFKNIIGLQSLKEKIVEFEDYILFTNKARKEGLDIPTQNMHMLFTGNPGCGKTTIARIIARMLFDIGILHENKLVEVERKDLVAEWIGQTAPKTAEVIEKAMGGVLFIDEAYSLTPSDSFRDFGQEAVATLIKAMEDHKGEFVVIFAGYKEEMKHFVESNAGIASRIGYTFDFPDYTDKELFEIFKMKMTKDGFKLEETAENKVMSIMKYFGGVESIGNGRFVDKVIQETLMNHAKNRSENISLITEKDIPDIKEMIDSVYSGKNMINPEDISEKSIRKTAIHEIGHAFLRYKLYNSPNIEKITINVEGTGNLGYVRYKPEKKFTNSKTDLLNQIKVSLAGMASEEIFNGEFENGNGSDLNKCTKICYNMITKYGMSDLGFAQIKDPSGEMLILINQESNKILTKCFEETKQIINENKELIEHLFTYLLEHREINEEQFFEQINVFNNK